MANLPPVQHNGGPGPRVIHTTNEKCPLCRGKGKVLTEGGKAILTLIENFQNDYRGRFYMQPPGGH